MKSGLNAIASNAGAWMAAESAGRQLQARIEANRRLASFPRSIRMGARAHEDLKGGWGELLDS